MTAPQDKGQELRTESERLRAKLREHVNQLESVVAELRAIADTDPVQQEAAHPRTTGDADADRRST